MSPAARVHAFEPFFSTKEATNSGLGLWTSNEIIRKHGTIRFRIRQAPPPRNCLALFLPENPTG